MYTVCSQVCVFDTCTGNYSDFHFYFCTVHLPSAEAEEVAATTNRFRDAISVNFETF
jgi:hypothetical protein